MLLAIISCVSILILVSSGHVVSHLIYLCGSTEKRVSRSPNYIKVFTQVKGVHCVFPQYVAHLRAGILEVMA